MCIDIILVAEERAVKKRPDALAAGDDRATSHKSRGECEHETGVGRLRLAGCCERRGAHRPRIGPSSSAAPDDWQQQWDAAVAAARKERELIISAPQGPHMARLADGLPEAYPEIDSSWPSREFWPRVRKEQEVGPYPRDLRVGGPDNLFRTLIE